MLDLGLSTTTRAVLGVRGAFTPPYSPPAGYRWDYVTEDGGLVLDRNDPVMELVRITA
jgi:hypothetical protein